MEVRIILKSGEVVPGWVDFSAGRDQGQGKRESVYVSLRGRLKGRGEEFYLQRHNCQRCVWGQGMEFPEDDMRLHPEDAITILTGGGG